MASVFSHPAIALGLGPVFASRGAGARLWAVGAACAVVPDIDVMTDGGLGVAFFTPFSNRRYFLPFRPLEVSPIGMQGFFGPRGVAILKTELVWVWLPCLALGAAGALARRRLRRT